jgi:type IV pilus assembly protein PilW
MFYNASTKVIKQQGLSLVELMVALGLSGFLAAAIFQIIVGNKVNIDLTESHAKTQESARIALELLTRDIRMAGFGGCANTTPSMCELLDTGDSDFDINLHQFTKQIDGIEGHNGVAQIGNKTPVAGSDVFVNRSATSTDIIVASTPGNRTEALEIKGTADSLAALKEGRIVMVTDCDNADIFSISSVSANKIEHAASVGAGVNNLSNELDKIYEAGSTINVMNSYAYFIAPSSVVRNPFFGSPKGSALGVSEFVNSLYKYSELGGDDAIELVPYIDDLQITYGIDSNGDAAVDEYLDRDAVVAAGHNLEEDAVSVKIEIVVTGVADVDAAQLDNYNDDGALRKRYSRVVFIRNSRIGNPTTSSAPLSGIKENCLATAEP